MAATGSGRQPPCGSCTLYSRPARVVSTSPGYFGDMDLPVMPPVAPMLAKPIDAIPDGDYIFEPKWDGFRSIVFRDGGEVEIGSRNERPMTRYFPELVTAILAILPERCVIDGEVVVPNFTTGRLDFEALQLRIH